jgi:glycosyltransferase involved in cell wall biosynthesis
LNYVGKKISILFVIDGLEFGGGERVFLQLAAGLRDRYEVFVAAMQGGIFEHELKRLEIQFFPVDINRRFSFKPILQLKRIIKERKIDFVHSQGARADFFARIGGKLAGVTNIVCTIAMPVEGFEVNLLRKKIYRFMDWLSERYIARFIVVSDSLRKTLIQRRGIPPEKVIKICNGIELDQYQPVKEQANLRKQWEISPETPVVGAIGRMVWQKGFEYLIQAIPIIIEKFPKTKTIIVGDGPLREKLETLGENLKVNRNVIFAGFQNDVREILFAIDVLVIPSLLEGFPMITLEAMAMSKPVVATNIDGITEQITHGKEGVLVQPRDPDALAEAVIKVLSRKEYSKAIGLAARKRAEEEFSVEKMLAETEKVYSFLLRGKQDEELSLLQ